MGRVWIVLEDPYYKHMRGLNSPVILTKEDIQLAVLAALLPEILDFPESTILKRFSDELVGEKVWAPLDLQEWLEDNGLAELEASHYTDHLIDYLLENDLGYEFGGITPWCGDGYSLYNDN